MRRFIAAILFCGLALAGRAAEDDYRFFTDTQGRSVQGMVTACDLARNRVTIERADNNQRVTVSIDGFCEEDQAFIREWYLANELLSDAKLRITCKEITVKEWTETETEEFSEAVTGEYAGARIETTDFEDIGYEITFQNKNDLPLKSLTLQYKIYYEQSETTTGKPETVQKIFEESVSLEDIKSDMQQKVSTKTVQIFRTQFSTDGDVTLMTSKTGGKGEVHGMRARLTMILPSGQKTMREFSQPSSLSDKRFPWLPPSP